MQHEIGWFARARSSVERTGFRALVGTGFIRTRLGASRSQPVDGRTLDPAVAAMLGLDDIARRSDLTPLSAVEGRARVAADCMTVNLPPPETDHQDLQIPSEAGAIPARLYVTPGLPAASAGIIYLHGGGWVTGSVATHDALCRLLACEAKCRVISIDYRLAPEHRFPAAVEDAVSATRWVLSHAGELGMDPARIAVAGDSAGGNLSAVVSLHTRNDRRRPKLQVLIYPALDMTCSTASYETFKDRYFLTRPLVDWFVNHYVGTHDVSDPDISPLRATSTSDIPALIYTAGFDVLRDEGLAYAERLRNVGARVKYKEYSHLIHGFVCMTAVKSALDATNEIAGDILRELST